jgi:hypothetical protein
MSEPQPQTPCSAAAGTAPAGFDRIAAVLVYFGLSPFLTPWLRRRRDTLAAHHARQSDALFLLLYAIVLTFLAAVAVLSVVMLKHRAVYDAGNYEAWTLSIFRKLLIGWAVFWVYGAGLALFGSRAEIPWFGGIGRWRGAVAARAALALTFLLAIVGGALAARGLALAPENASPARACLLYEDVDGRYPRWLFGLGYYPAIEAAHERWGGGVSLRRLTRENLLAATGEAEFLFIGSHGMTEGILLMSGFVTPADVRGAGAHPQLRYVYLAGCDSGALKKDWEAVFAPARVVTQTGLTPLIQHIGWLWFDAPKVIAGM